MGDRIKVFGILAVMGFLAGVAAELTAEYIFPVLLPLLPALLSIRYVISGLAGACLTLVLVTIWAYVSGSPKD